MLESLFFHGRKFRGKNCFTVVFLNFSKQNILRGKSIVCVVSPIFCFSTRALKNSYDLATRKRQKKEHFLPLDQIFSLKNSKHKTSFSCPLNFRAEKKNMLNQKRLFRLFTGLAAISYKTKHDWIVTTWHFFNLVTTLQSQNYEVFFLQNHFAHFQKQCLYLQRTCAQNSFETQLTINVTKILPAQEPFRTSNPNYTTPSLTSPNKFPTTNPTSWLPFGFFVCTVSEKTGKYF